MKKLLCLFFVMVLISGSVFAAGGRLIFNLYGNVISMPENTFTDQESQYKMYFEAKAAFTVWTNLYLWASHGYLPIHDEWTGWSSKNSFARTSTGGAYAGQADRFRRLRIFCRFFAKESIRRARSMSASVPSPITSTQETSESTRSNCSVAETAKQAGDRRAGKPGFHLRVL